MTWIEEREKSRGLKLLEIDERIKQIRSVILSEGEPLSLNALLSYYNELKRLQQARKECL